MTESATDPAQIHFGKALGVFALYILSNILLTVLFSVLWVLQYKMNPDVSDSIDHIVVPWGWLASYFAINVFFLRRAFSWLQSILTSLVFAVLLSLFLYLVIHIVLTPIYDPWF